VRSTPVVVLAALLACLPARAVELIELQDGARLSAPRSAHPPAYFTHPSIHPPAYPADDFFKLERSEIPATALLDSLPAAAPGPLAAPVAVSVVTPVPEPVSVFMLACGLLLMVPGAWAARWSRLGDSESLLQRRLP